MNFTACTSIINQRQVQKIKQNKIIMKFSQAISWVRWFSFLQTNVSKAISVLILRVVELM
jgi:hypothetical protein